MNLSGKTAIVTGGGSGIGAALAAQLASLGAKIVVADLHIDAAQSVANKIDGLAIACDVRDETQVKALVTQAEAHLGPVELFCSNAGVLTLDEPGWSAVGASNETWQLAWDVHVMAHVYAARACLPGMIERGHGILLNTVSAAGLLNQIGGAPYSASKHAAIGFAESLAITHQEQGIQVAVLCPQGVKTPMVEGAGDMSDGGPAGVDGMLSAEQVASAAIASLESGDFLILPHPSVANYFQAKAADYNRWLGGMRKLRRAYPFPDPRFDL